MSAKKTNPAKAGDGGGVATPPPPLHRFYRVTDVRAFWYRGQSLRVVPGARYTADRDLCAFLASQNDPAIVWDDAT
jgi:hypothetical protein